MSTCYATGEKTGLQNHYFLSYGKRFHAKSYISWLLIYFKKHNRNEKDTTRSVCRHPLRPWPYKHRHAKNITYQLVYVGMYVALSLSLMQRALRGKRDGRFDLHPQSFDRIIVTIDELGMFHGLEYSVGIRKMSTKAVSYLLLRAALSLSPYGIICAARENRFVYVSAMV